MAVVERVQFRAASAGDAPAVASLHSESWRRHYRGAYSDSFLDGDVAEDRLRVWTQRLEAPDGAATILAEEGGSLVGFVHVVFDADATWGALVDNLHVTRDAKRAGVGSRLVALAARTVLDRAAGSGLYLWVLEQNRDAQAFYEARRGRCVERAQTEPPGGVPDRLVGAPAKLRYVWSDPAVLLG